MNYSDFEEKATQKWAGVHKDLFGSEVPKNMEWTKINEIIKVLNCIGGMGGLNHMFFPDHGGMDLHGAGLSTEAGCIELFVGSRSPVYILKPNRLVFESIDIQQNWNFFRLECGLLNLTGVYGHEPKYMAEELLELGPGEYINRKYADIGEYKGAVIPASARIIMRYVKGDIVIFKKTSPFNVASSYDAPHQKMGADGFKEHIISAHKSISSRN